MELRQESEFPKLVHTYCKGEQTEYFERQNFEDRYLFGGKAYLVGILRIIMTKM